MSFSCGIVGLPNVGKSTLFNCLTAGNAEVSNYPFCTINPNIGAVRIPDNRLEKLNLLLNPVELRSAAIEFVDIAGVVKGASHGEGLGNRFLAEIRNVSCILHVIRCFGFTSASGDVSHTSQRERSPDPSGLSPRGRSIDRGGLPTRPNPVEDARIVNMELALSDLEVVERRLEKMGQMLKRGKSSSKPGVHSSEKAASDEERELLLKIKDGLQRGKRACLHESGVGNLKLVPVKTGLDPEMDSQLQFTPLDSRFRGNDKRGGNDRQRGSVNFLKTGAKFPFPLSELNLLTAKPQILAANVGEKDIGKSFKELEDFANEEKAPLFYISAQFESELLELAEDEAEEFRKSAGVTGSSLDMLITASFSALKLITFYTAANEKVSAWTVPEGTLAPQAAGKVHSDMERAFIKAEVVSFEDFEKCGSGDNCGAGGRQAQPLHAGVSLAGRQAVPLRAAKEKGLIRIVGKDYVVQDGDIIYFHFR